MVNLNENKFKGNIKWEYYVNSLLVNFSFGDSSYICSIIQSDLFDNLRNDIYSANSKRMKNALLFFANCFKIWNFGINHLLDDYRIIENILRRMEKNYSQMKGRDIEIILEIFTNYIELGFYEVDINEGKLVPKSDSKNQNLLDFVWLGGMHFLEYYMNICNDEFIYEKIVEFMDKYIEDKIDE